VDFYHYSLAGIQREKISAAVIVVVIQIENRIMMLRRETSMLSLVILVFVMPSPTLSRPEPRLTDNRRSAQELADSIAQSLSYGRNALTLE
jgi:hypothetical protein